MFSKLNVRSKLLTMVTPALVGLCALGVLGVQTRLHSQSDAEVRRDVVTATRAASVLLHEVQRERVLEVTKAVVDDAVPSSALQQQREITDAAAKRAAKFAGSLSSADVAAVGSSDSGEDLSQLKTLIGGIEAVRADGAKKAPADLVTGYDGLASGLLRSIGRLELALSPTDSNVVSRHWMASGIEAQMAAAASASLSLRGEGAATDPDLATSISDLSAESAISMDSFAEYAGAEGRDSLRKAQESMAYEISTEAFDQLSTPAGAAAFTADPVTWPNVVAGRLGALAQVESSSYGADISALDSAADDAQSAVRTFSAAVAAALLVMGLLAFVISRSITTALRRLTETAKEITNEQLPALVEALKTGTSQPDTVFTEIDVRSSDEFAEVGRAINELGRATAEVAAEQHRSLQKGIGDIFVNLARRNQSLLDRQIQFIDRLEANEQDADQLDHLFKLDHLATRMRRNAESLLVLAGAEAQRRRPRDVSMSDVIRIAVGEVEDFARITLTAVDAAEVQGGAGSDITHLLAELMENGTQYSPPDRNVDVIGHRRSDGAYVVTISDQGVGMSTERIIAANDALLKPPPVGLALSRSLGFVVAGTLAARHGVVIRLSESGHGGISAEVTIPAVLLRDGAEGQDHQWPVTEVGAEMSTETSTARAFEPASGSTLEMAAGWTLDGEYVSPVVDEPAFEPAFGPPTFDPSAFDLDSFAPAWSAESVPDAPVPTKLSDAVPAGERFEAGLNSLLGVQTEQPMVTPAAPAALPQRRPGATMSTFEVGTEFPMAPQTRAPEEVRSVLSRYRSGLVTGRTDSTDSSTDTSTDPHTAGEDHR